MNSEEMIKAVTDDVVYNEGNEIKTLDGSVQADIVINRDDKEYINEETEQTNKLFDDELISSWTYGHHGNRHIKFLFKFQQIISRLLRQIVPIDYFI